MYLDHFGLREPPFGITPNPDFFFEGNMRGELLEALCCAIEAGEGFVKVTGEVGSGKTMLCRMLEHRLAPHIDIIYIANPTLLPREVCHAVASELGLHTAGLRLDEAIRLVQADLIARHERGRQVVLLVEEAQAMPLETLEELRLLSNLETSRDKLLQIVLFGQPELDRHLDLPHMRQLRERITQSFSVPLMPEPTVYDFLAFRLHAAGYRGERVFSVGATRCISRAARGVVRRISILADKALLAAYIDDARRVELRHAQAALRDSPFRPRAALPRMGAALLGGVRWLAPGARHD
ncbi:ExeA family protein [Pseudoduganella sp. GCM10020061]|uniref:ExeA family protein n=1 Tax=Pseudoduganella sp. GCM10020061 TaxID=3317345 RepID=UPI003625D521